MIVFYIVSFFQDIEIFCEGNGLGVFFLSGEVMFCNV